MVRRLEPRAGMNILVTSARSNTSLFVINALRKHQANVFATTSAMDYKQALQDLGVKEVIEAARDSATGMMSGQLRDLVLTLGGFDCVIDPFFDLHLDKLIHCLAPYGRYITCGLHDQYLTVETPRHSGDIDVMKQILLSALVKNLHIVGNCLGTSDDLKNAIRDFASGTFPVVVDRVCGDGEVGLFFRRTYTDHDRFGKVVYRYDG
jgi:NADPH:quinone reductase-like Zn-dependent oxidoreductase